MSIEWRRDRESRRPLIQPELSPGIPEPGPKPLIRTFLWGERKELTNCWRREGDPPRVEVRQEEELVPLSATTAGHPFRLPTLVADDALQPEVGEVAAPDDRFAR